ncbi:MAG TPA: hypothetical protein VEY07_00620 [Thermoplasmata archaeon]|nr:hypothetical protein [Thermoplasmata archaeon]
MLLDTTFKIGGILVLALGTFFVVALAVTGAIEAAPELVVPIVPFFVIGVVFLLVGRGARRYREELLRVGEPAAPLRPR